MSLADDVKAPIRHADRVFIGRQWVQPSSDAMIKVTDSGTEELVLQRGGGAGGGHIAGGRGRAGGTCCTPSRNSAPSARS